MEKAKKIVYVFFNAAKVTLTVSTLIVLLTLYIKFVRNSMKAIVVHDFKQPPQWEDFQDPVAATDEYLIKVEAAALSNLVKARADGSHYSSVANFPFVPGVDGTGRLEDGSRIYFLFPSHPFGAMGEYAVVPKAMCVPLPDDLDAVTAAAIANPAMSSWCALVDRAHIVPGETVLINGASGSSGGMAIHIAKHLGAKKVIATAREHHLERLMNMGADEVISLSTEPETLLSQLKQLFIEQPVSIVLDYLWGASAETILSAIGQAHQTYRIRFVQIGSISGPVISFNAFPLRSTNLTLLGSGLGSVSNEDLLKGISDAFKVAHQLNLSVDIQAVPMQNASSVWNQTMGTKRVVFTL